MFTREAIILERKVTNIPPHKQTISTLNQFYRPEHKTTGKRTTLLQQARLLALRGDK